MDLTSAILTSNRRFKQAVAPPTFQLIKTISPTENMASLTTSRSVAGTYVDASLGVQNSAINTARVDHRTGSAKILLEEADSNLYKNSETFSDWALNNVTLTNNAGASPRGDNVKKIVENTVNTFHRINILNPLGTVPVTGRNYVISIFVKASGRSHCCFRYNKGAGVYYNTGFNLTNGTVTYTKSDTDAGIIPYGNGWFKCWVRFTADAATNAIDTGFVLAASDVLSDTIPQYLGNGTSGVFVWGAGINGNILKPSSYIPSSGVAVTRPIDTITTTPPAGTNKIILYKDGRAIHITNIPATYQLPVPAEIEKIEFYQ